MEVTASKTENTTKPRSIRLTDAQYAALQEKAGKLPWGQFVKQQLGLEDASVRNRRPRRRRPQIDQATLNELSAFMTNLSASRIPNNLNQLAKAANMGALPFDPDDRDTLLDSAQAVKEIRAMLMKALGAAA